MEAGRVKEEGRRWRGGIHRERDKKLRNIKREKERGESVIRKNERKDKKERMKEKKKIRKREVTSQEHS